eukprot:c15228_g1_i2 orf=666-1307(+)
MIWKSNLHQCYCLHPAAMRKQFQTAVRNPLSQPIKFPDKDCKEGQNFANSTVPISTTELFQERIGLPPKLQQVDDINHHQESMKCIDSISNLEGLEMPQNQRECTCVDQVFWGGHIGKWAAASHGGLCAETEQIPDYTATSTDNQPVQKQVPSFQASSSEDFKAMQATLEHLVNQLDILTKTVSLIGDRLSCTEDKVIRLEKQRNLKRDSSNS